MKRSKGGEACEAGISGYDMPMQPGEAYRRLSSFDARRNL